MNDAKYIGLDVHQATISVAVLDSAGKLVMEAILETKAETILQFIHGLRGSLHVTFEDESWAQERPCRRTQAGRTVVPEQAQPGLSRRNRNPRAQGTGPQLFGTDPRYHAGDESCESSLQKLGHSLCGAARVRTTLSLGVARQDHRSRRASPGGDLLPAVGRLAVVARASTTRSIGRRPETQRHEIAATNSFDWTHSGRFVDCSDADATSFSYQAATVGVLWFGIENFHERGIPNRGGPAKTLQEIPGHPRTERQPQSRSEKYLQGSRDPGRCRPWTVPRVPCRFSGQRDEANDGTPHFGAQDRGHHFDRLEERSSLRRRTSKTTSSLSVCGESIPGFISGDDRLVLQTLWFE